MNDRFKFRVFYKDEMYFVLSLDEQHIVVTPSLVVTSARTLNTKDCILMQCTGLKDKNGKLIYEGDIVKRDSEMLQQYIIKWNDKGFWCADDYALAFANTTISTEYEVIGNIYENKELLDERN